METFSLDNFITLGMLVMLQAVLGFDNLLYISLESKSAPADKQKMVRQVGIGLAVFLRIGLLFALISVIGYFQDPIFGINIGSYIKSDFNLHALIVLLGGAFIIYTATKEIWHMVLLEEKHEAEAGKTRSAGSVIIMIVVMNLVFSFDSILSAMALSDVFWVMASAIVIGGILMIWLSDRVATFLQKNRMYEVLGLFVLFLVGIMLLTEGGHLAHIYLFGNEITPMSKTTFYFILVILVLIDIVQGRYQRKLSMAKATKSKPQES
ncbi:MAG: tellurium resistance protein TerC [Bacteroidetes bacterium]|nr:MAG: tellurium resistance protein TerC [Bacteroidota bacterium]